MAGIIIIMTYIFFVYRTAEEIEDAANTSIEGLRDPQEDSARVKNPKWLITLGICTHLGCIPIPNKGNIASENCLFSYV